MKAPIDRCPHCRSKDGYYTKEYASGSVKMNFNYDGSEAENGELHDNLTYSGGVYAYCSNCRKRLFKMTEV